MADSSIYLGYFPIDNDFNKLRIITQLNDYLTKGYSAFGKESKGSLIPRSFISQIEFLCFLSFISQFEEYELIRFIPIISLFRCRLKIDVPDKGIFYLTIVEEDYDDYICMEVSEVFKIKANSRYDSIQKTNYRLGKGNLRIGFIDVVKDLEPNIINLVEIIRNLIK